MKTGKLFYRLGKYYGICPIVEPKQITVPVASPYGHEATAEFTIRHTGKPIYLINDEHKILTADKIRILIGFSPESFLYLDNDIIWVSQRHLIPPEEYQDLVKDYAKVFDVEIPKDYFKKYNEFYKSIKEGKWKNF